MLGTYDLTPHVSPTVTIDGRDLSEASKAKLLRTVVDTNLHLPDMFEVVFNDAENSVLNDVHIGSVVEIYGGAPSSTTASKLIVGEVISIEGDYEGMVLHTIVRGYDRSHRLQRVSRTRTFLDSTDSDIAKKIADEAKFDKKEIDDTRTTHEHVSQIAQTDWDFLKQRAVEIGYETGVANGTFYFRKAADASGGGGGLSAAVPSALPGSGPPTLTLKQNLIAFRPRLSAAGLVPDVEVRVWDPDSADVIVGAAKVKTGTAKLDKDPAALAQSFPTAPVPLPEPPKIPDMPSLGAAPSSSARLIVDLPVDHGASAQTAADEVAAGLAEHIGSTFAEADGLAFGNPDIQPGKPVKIDGVPEEFKGTWIVTSAKHTFVPDEGGYRTWFEVSGRHDRSLLGLATLGGGTTARSMPGLVPGVVTNNDDPHKKGRVKLAFPWLAPSYESDWARVAQLGAGKKWGAIFLPEVGDEVLVGFEFADIRRPYVVAGLVNGKTQHDLLDGAIKTTGPLSQVTKRGLVSRLGNRIVFEDEEPAPNAPVPTSSSITIGDKDAKVQVVIDKKNGEVRIVCDSSLPPGKITVEQKGQGGSITVKSAGNISLEAAAPGQVSIKAAGGVSIDGSPGVVEIKGSIIKLN